MDKFEALKKLKDEVATAELMLMESNLVFGEGNPDSKVMFIGEAPGFYEDMQKRPFVGRGGQLLNQMLTDIGWDRESVYITNIVKRRPPENRDPLPEEIEAYKPFLAKEIEIVNPKIIVPLGRFAMNYFLPEAKITRDQGRAFKKNGWLIYPIFHPAAALRNPNVLEEFKKSFQNLPKVINKDPAVVPKPTDENSSNNPPPQPGLF